MRRLRIGTPRVALIVAPHADDETIGAFGLIRLLRLRGTRVVVLLVTDGAASHPNSERWPRKRLVAERLRETRRVLRRSRVPASDIVALGLPDGGLSALTGFQRAPIDRAVRRVRHLDLIVAPSDADAHPDHRVVAGSVRRRDVRHLRYVVWSDRNRLAAGATRTLPLGPAALAKRSAVLGYRTQMGAITDDPEGFTISRREFAAFTRAAETYREDRR